MSKLFPVSLLLVFVSLGVIAASAQSFRVQCPDGTKLHPATGTARNPIPNPNIKCQEISGGDGFATMGDGHQIYLFGFGPLSGMKDISNGLPGTQPASIFNLTDVNPPLPNGLLAPTYTSNGAIVDPAAIMNVGVLNASEPAPLMAIDEDDEFFLTLTNVGMIMRPDLFEQHTVHFHGYPNASSYFDGVPDASIAVNIGGSMTYYYTAPDAGTYFWHCHITPPEHLQMGMVGQLYVRPRQNRLLAGSDLRASLVTANLRAPGATNGLSCSDLLCTGQTPAPATSASQVAGLKYAYNDGDASTRYDKEYPLQIMGFDPDFHFVGTTFNPEGFASMKDKYFMLSGRSYPDTVTEGAIPTQSSDGMLRVSQPIASLITLNSNGGMNGQGERALLRVSDLDTTEFQTLATVGIPMHVVGLDARLLRDMAGDNMSYDTNSITMGGGQSADVILDSCATRDAGGNCTARVPAGTYFLYTTNLDHLSNDAENFGGMMTEIVVQ
jgi:FtsP/CotA-like multicopper oxidase with cupredoxin domain